MDRATRQAEIAGYLRQFTRQAEDLDDAGQVDDGRTVDIDCTPLPKIPIEALALGARERQLEVRAWYHSWEQWSAGLQRLEPPVLEPRPCTAMPASLLKIAVLAERETHREALFSADDRDREPGAAPVPDRRRKGFRLFTGGREPPGGFELSAKDHEDLDKIRAVAARARGFRLVSEEGGAA